MANLPLQTVMKTTHAITDREAQQQMLDNMDIERERGITVKSQTVRLVTKPLTAKSTL